VTQSDVTLLMDSYRECARHVWNCYFSKDAEPAQDWNLRDDFNNLALGLFRALVLRKLGRDDAKILPDHVIPPQPLLFLKLEAPVGSLIHVNRSTEATSGYWDDPVDRVELNAIDLRFVQYFDWSDLSFRDFAYYRARIVASRPYPHLIGRDALLPVGASVKVFYKRIGSDQKRRRS